MRNVLIGLIGESEERVMDTCLNLQEDVHQGPRIEFVYKAPPAPLDGLREERW